MHRNIRLALLASGILCGLGCSLIRGSTSAGSPAVQPAPTDTPAAAEAPAATAQPPTQTPKGDPIQYVSRQSYRVNSVWTVANSGFAITELRVYLPKPVDWDEQKDVRVTNTTPDGMKEGLDTVFGDEFFSWHLYNQPTVGKSVVFSTAFTFTAFETRTQIDPKSVSPYNRLSTLYKLYTRSEPYIESGDPEIRALADTIVGSETNPYLRAKKFYDYVVDTIRYQSVDGLIGAKAVLRSGAGECGDYSALFIALARAAGIPARSVVGFWAISGTDQTHVWAEFYLEDIGWIPVDPTVGQAQREKDGVVEYYFGNMDNQRVILSKGFNVRLEPSAPGGYVAPLVQTAFWWYWGSSGDGSRVTLDHTLWSVSRI
jgi:transglutaminase/protease-like cytokinesis protein 3